MSEMIRHEIDPASAGWSYLSFSLLDIAPGESHAIAADELERAVVPISGTARVVAGEDGWDLSRTSVFAQSAHLLYLPPGPDIVVSSEAGSTLAIGAAPAEGRHRAALIEPRSIKREVRGGGAARRQVEHLLAHPLPAERLISYEVYVPRGGWSGWPPHCHDRHAGSPYLEETYWFRFDRPEGWGIHRNWHDDGSIDETFAVRDGDLVLVPGGYHSSAACPGANMYFLNFLAGEPTDDDRGRAPVFHPDHTWIERDWSAGEWSLPLTRP
jgi:5-deoxy-glucuronate isomerase